MSLLSASHFTWSLYPKCVSLFFFAQRASVSFWAFFAAFSGFSHSSGISPFLILSFSSRRFLWRGTSTNVASIIVPLWVIKPSDSSILSKKQNNSSIAFVCARSFLNFQIVFASGTLSHNSNPRKRIKLRLSLIWYSVWSSERLYSRCNTRILNIITTSYDGRPPLRVFSFRTTALFRMSRNISQFMTLFSISSGSPILLIFSILVSSSKKLLCLIFMFLLYHIPARLCRGF